MDDETLNIYAERGTNVIYTGENGYPSDHIRYHKNGMRVGDIYTVEDTDVGVFSTSVYLEEFPNVAVNSVCLREINKEV